MENLIKEQLASQRIWATLAIVLIFYILRAQEKRDKIQDEREMKYQKIIIDLTNQLNITKEIREDIDIIRKHISKQ